MKPFLPSLLLVLPSCSSYYLQRPLVAQSRGKTALQVAASPNVGVLLLNLGGPETGDDVEGSYAHIELWIRVLAARIDKTQCTHESYRLRIPL